MHKSSQRISIAPDKLTAHFKEHFSATNLEEPPEISNPEQFPYLAEKPFEINQEPPTKEEIRAACLTFKNNKSAGTDRIPTEVLKYSRSPALLHALWMIMGFVWATVAVPSTWLHSAITCLHKKGHKSLPVNYRALSVGANVSKIFPRIIMNRVDEIYESVMSENQFGFRKGRSTADAIFTVRSIIDKCDGAIIAIFVDLTAAYDRIDRVCLFKVLSIRTGAPFLANLLYKLYQTTTATIRGTKLPFEVLSGCRQGGLESPSLFNLYFDFVLKVCANEIDRRFPDGWGISTRFRFPGECYNRKRDGRMSGIEVIRWLLYADDLAAFCRSVVEAQAIIEIMHRVCMRFGLTISLKKTKTMVFGDKLLAKKTSLISVDGKQLENVQEFCYLGHSISTKPDSSFVDRRIASATAKFNQLGQVLKDQDVHKPIRKKFLETYVRSRLTYATEAQLPNAEELRRMEVFWHGCLRRMARNGHRRKLVPNGEQSYALHYSNQDLCKMFKTTSVAEFVKYRRIKYIAHIARRDGTNLSKRALFMVPTKKYVRDPWIDIANELNVDITQAKRETQNRKNFTRLLEARFGAKLAGDYTGPTRT